MKRIVLLLLSLSLLCSLQCKKKPENIARNGFINAMSGMATIIDGDTTKTAKVGDPVRQGMIIKTGERSFVDIYFDQNAIKIMEKSIVKITQLETMVADGSEKSRFIVNKGRMFSKVAKKLGKNDIYTVSTPTATAGVRGTEFLVESEELKSLIACLNGEVEVKKEELSEGKEEKALEEEKGGGKQETVILHSEEQVVVEKDKPMTVEELSADNKKMIEDIKKNFQDVKRELREIFEKQREEIRRTVEEQKKKNKEDVERQKEIDRQNVEQQKAMDKENIERIKGKSQETKSQAEDAVIRQKEETKKNLEGVKPEIKKFDTNIE